MVRVEWEDVWPELVGSQVALRQQHAVDVVNGLLPKVRKDLFDGGDLHQVGASAGVAEHGAPEVPPGGLLQVSSYIT